MSRDVSLILMAVYRQTQEEGGDNGVYQLKYDLEITTETHIIKMPIEAQIVNAVEFRNMFMGNLEAGKGKNVRILSVRPGSTKEVLTKPIKDAITS